MALTLSVLAAIVFSVLVVAGAIIGLGVWRARTKTSQARLASEDVSDNATEDETGDVPNIPEDMAEDESDMIDLDAGGLMTESDETTEAAVQEELEAAEREAEAAAQEEREAAEREAAEREAAEREAAEREAADREAAEREAADREAAEREAAEREAAEREAAEREKAELEAAEREAAEREAAEREAAAKAELEAAAKQHAEQLKRNALMYTGRELSGFGSGCDGDYEEDGQASIQSSFGQEIPIGLRYVKFASNGTVTHTLAVSDTSITCFRGAQTRKENELNAKSLSDPSITWKNPLLS